MSAVVWPYPPSEFKETLSFLTDVRQAPAGEMRDSLRTGRIEAQLLFPMDFQRRVAAEAVFRQNAMGMWHVPLWPELTRLPSGILSSATSVSGVNTDASYFVGGFAFVTDGSAWEAIEIAGISPGELSFVGTLSRDYASARIMPTFEAQCAEGLQASREFALDRLSVGFVGSSPVGFEADPFVVYNGSAVGGVVTDASVVVTPLQDGVAQALEFIDTGFGATALERVEKYSRLRSTIAWSDDDSARRWRMKRWLHYLRGRDRGFWLPSFRTDFALIGSASSGQANFTVSEIEEAAFPDLVGRALYILGPSGGYSVRTIASLTALGGATRVTVNGTLVEALNQSARVSLMTFSRLDTDQVEIRHQLTGDARFLSSFSLSTIEVLA